MSNALKKIAVRFYESNTGRQPVRDWLVGLSDDDCRQIGIDMQLVEFGWPIGMPYCRALGQGLWEVRSNLSGGRIARVIFFISGADMVLVNGFEKKSQKTPAREIELALKRKRELET